MKNKNIPKTTNYDAFIAIEFKQYSIQKINQSLMHFERMLQETTRANKNIFNNLTREILEEIIDAHTEHLNTGE